MTPTISISFMQEPLLDNNISDNKERSNYGIKPSLSKHIIRALALLSLMSVENGQIFSLIYYFARLNH